MQFLYLPASRFPSLHVVVAPIEAARTEGVQSVFINMHVSSATRYFRLFGKAVLPAMPSCTDTKHVVVVVARSRRRGCVPENECAPDP